MRTPDRLVVAVTGPTGTFGFGLVPRLEADDRIAEIRGIARRPFDPATHGWTKTTYQQGDVRDADALAEVFAGSDVVVHLAFLVAGNAAPDVLHAVNVEGTYNAFRAATRARVSRFVYASSVAAYGFHRDNPIGIREDWPTRPDHRLFYAAEKAEIELGLQHASSGRDAPDLYVLRPPIVLGPHAVGAKVTVPSTLEPVVERAGRMVRHVRVALPVVLPALPLQLIHEDDVGDALCRCVVGAGPPGAFNVAGDGVVTTHDIARALGFVPLPFPARVAQGLARAVAALSRPAFVPPVLEWTE